MTESRLNWQQKAEALNALAPLSISLRPKLGDWAVVQAVDVKDGIKLIRAYGYGRTPDEALESHWQKLVGDVGVGPTYLVVGASGPSRTCVRWNGFMWVKVAEDE